MIRTGGGTFNPAETFIYFLAANTSRQQHAVRYHRYNLIAVNEIGGGEDVRTMEKWLTEGNRVFIDSGIYNLTMEHARKHGCSMNDALALSPQQIDGFDELLEKYLHIVRTYQDRCWGYIELDQGGRENKIRTRTMLEGMGLRPIPVYHPLNDGWDYFDYLAERYDRICFGNIVRADARTRRRIVLTAWQRHRRYPHLWIHLLGLTPNEMLYALPINSGDSSTWLGVLRWNGYLERTMGKSFGPMERNFMYLLADTGWERGDRKAVAMSAYGAILGQQNWHHYMARLSDVGVDYLPSIEEDCDL